MPVLAVGAIPERDRVLGTGRGRRHGLRREEPLAHDPRAVGRDRRERVPHDVVREQGEEQVGEDGIVVDASAVLFGQHADRLRACRPATQRQAVARRVDRHVAAEYGALGEVVGAATVVGEARQLGVNARAVVALREVLEEELPVGAHVVLDAAEGPQLGEPPRGELPGEAREGGREGGWLRRLPRGEGHAVERELRGVEPRRVAHVRRAEQAAVEGVGPAVVRALDRAAQPARRRLAEARPAVPAHVEERAGASFPIAHDDQALPRRVGQEVIPRLRDLVCAAHTHPAPGEDAIGLLAVDRLRGVVGLRQRPDLARERVAAVDHGLAHRFVSRRSARPGRRPVAAPAS